ncbi:tyrosine-type recombinase/integrase [Sorangium sp. So ce1182]|uniref:tyrosine-type recombinase/integrase n=1 Tax=Sorangium sp. So ce1182 TaxID=3133334 RepID=UPI003F5ED2A6
MVPLCFRIYYGFLTREGMRADEAGTLEWSDVDLKRGAVVLDENKTDDPRAWALSPDVVRALRAYRELCPDNRHVFVGPKGDHLPGCHGAGGVPSRSCSRPPVAEDRIPGALARPLQRHRERPLPSPVSALGSVVFRQQPG